MYQVALLIFRKGRTKLISSLSNGEWKKELRDFGLWGNQFNFYIFYSSLGLSINSTEIFVENISNSFQKDYILNALPHVFETAYVAFNIIRESTLFTFLCQCRDEISEAFMKLFFWDKTFFWIKYLKNLFYIKIYFFSAVVIEGLVIKF